MSGAKVRDLMRSVREALSSSGVEGACLEARLILSAALGVPQELLLSRPELELSEEEVSRVESMVRRRSTRDPLAYVLGEWEFFGLRLKVLRGVFVPRPETEILVEKALSLAGEGGTMLDWGCGSGCIGLAFLVHRPGWRLWAMDTSARAISNAWMNFKEHGLLGKVRLVHGSNRSLSSSVEFDLIASNPPYIPTAELEYLMPEVRREPREALDGGPDGTRCYLQVLELAGERLVEGGFLLLELGSTGIEEVLSERGAQMGLRAVETVYDLRGLPRVLVLRRVRP